MALGPDIYRRLLRPLLFGLPPETAQKAAELALKRPLIWRLLAAASPADDPRLRTKLCGLPLSNPVGLAAGFDKNCEMLPALKTLGFGYLTCGTVTEFPRPGNPRPRVVRLVSDRSLINALGFPNKGVESCARNLELARNTVGDTPIVVSLSGTTADEIVRCHRRLEPLIDAAEVNISSPNTAGLRVFHEPSVLGELIERVNHTRRKPLMVKLPPYQAPGPTQGHESEARDRVLDLARVCRATGVDALTIANSRPISDARLSTGTGGLSGRAVFEDMLRMVAAVKAEVGDRPEINACGGVFSGEDAWRALQAGATTVQLYTGLVYRGPGVARRINRELLSIVGREGAALPQ